MQMTTISQGWGLANMRGESKHGELIIKNALGHSVSMPLSDIDGVLFDFDGTIADSGWVWDVVNEAFLSRRGLPKTDEYMRTVAALGMVRGCLYTKETFGLAETEDEIRRELCEMADRLYADKVELFDGAKEVIGSLRQVGIPVALVTLNSRRVLESMADRVDVIGLFDALVSEEDATCGKDRPDSFLLGCERLGLGMGRSHHPERVVVFEDTPISVATATEEGFTTYMKLGGRHKPLPDSDRSIMFSDWDDVAVG